MPVSRYVFFANNANRAFEEEVRETVTQADEADSAAVAAEAVALQTPRMINGVPFDGTEDINIEAIPSHSIHKTMFVDPDGDNSRSGRNDAKAVKHLERAFELIENQPDPTGWTVKLLGNVSTSGELPVELATVQSANMQRRAVITPTTGNEGKNVFLAGNGAHFYGLKFSGWQVNAFDDPAGPTGGFAVAFKPDSIILPGGVPYVQNCVVTSAFTEVPTPLPMDAPAGNPAQPRGGGCVLADAAVLSAYSVFPNIMTWGFTPASSNGLGYVARNRGFINPVNAIGVGAHRHFMALDGGQMVTSACSSQFGDYSFWSEGSVFRVVPLRVNPSVLTTQADAATVINCARALVIADVWAFLETNYAAGTWPARFEELTRKDTGLLLDAIAASLVHGFERPMLNFAEGMFKFDGNCVYEFAFHAAFKASWDRVASQLVGSNKLTDQAEAMVLALIARLKATMDNYWFEVEHGTAPSPVEPVRRRLRSLITAIAHQWTAPRAGVEFYRVPPARLARRIQRSIVQRNGGKVRFSGQDDGGNAVFVGGLRIDARSGQLGGPPFDSAIRSRLTRGIIARSY